MKYSTYLSAATLGLGLAFCSTSHAVPVAYNGHLYDLLAANTWTGAEAAAVSAGGHLVAIDDAAEENFLRTTFSSFEHLWIGFTDQAVEGTFVWSNGQAITYTNWSSGEPNNAGNEDYAVLNWNSGTGGWNDLPNLGGIRGIMEIENVPDGGSSVLLLGIGLCALAARRSRSIKG